MIKNISVALFALAVVLAPYGGGTAQAAGLFEGEVTIDAVSPGCGTQSISFSGTARFEQINDHLRVWLDEDLIHSDDDISKDSAEAWTAGAVSVSPGDHEIVAIVADMEGDIDPDGVHNDDQVIARMDFSVSACSSSDSGSGDGDTGDQGPGGDCCPGPDPITEEEQQQIIKKIAGATSATGLPARLKPLNSIFRSVYGRNPTFSEWEYWANRLLTDKPEYDALFGAMQWHELRGQTIGS